MKRILLGSSILCLIVSILWQPVPFVATGATELAMKPEITIVHRESISEAIEVPIQAIQEQQNTYLDIPLSNEIQDYTMELCIQYDVEYELVIALMKIESNFKSDLISSTNDYGIMQINKINHKWLQEKLGITDFLDIKQNILCGVYMLSDLYKRYGDEHKTLMAYNFGEGGMRKVWNKGFRSSGYSRKIMGDYEKLKGENECEVNNGAAENSGG